MARTAVLAALTCCRQVHYGVWRRRSATLILRQGVVLPETPRQRRERAALEDDLQTIALTGKPLPVRARHFRPTAEAYLVATRGPLPYMLRLREIEQRTEAHESTLRDGVARARRGLRRASPTRFRSEWLARAARERSTR